MDELKKTHQAPGGWAQKAPPKESFDQCPLPTRALRTNLNATYEVISPAAVGGLQTKPCVGTTRVRRSLVDLTYAERNKQEVPMSPLASRSRMPGSLASPTEQAHRRPFRERSQNRLSNQGMQQKVATNSNKKAVLITLNYVNTEGARKLKSCGGTSILYDLLVSNLGFSRENVWVLTDEPRAVRGAVTFAPTRGNIISSMRWLVRNSSRGDQLVFSFRGHGCRLLRKGCIDDCVLPSDYPTSCPIKEREIQDILVQDLKSGATLTALFDCGNSARLMKLPYVHVVMNGPKGSFSMREELDISNENGGTTGGVVLNSVLRFSRVKRDNPEIRRKAAEERRNASAARCFDNGTVICITASPEVTDASTSHDCSSVDHGALIFAFASYMRHSVSQKNKPSYSSVLCAMSGWLSSNVEDRLPRFSCTHNVSPDVTVTLL